MLNKRLIWQLYPSQLLITLVALLAVTWFGSHFLRNFHLEQTAKDLVARAHLTEEKVFDLLSRGQYRELLDFSRQVGKKADTRITIIAPAGKVLADSMEEPSRMDNHADRPEVAAALKGSITPSIRYSYTLQENLMYVAIPIRDKEKVIGVLRTSIPVTNIDKALESIYAKIIFGCVLIAFVVALIAWFLSRRISQPLEEMKKTAVQFAQGDFSNKLHVAGSEEVAGLAEALNSMATQLDDRFKTIVRQHSELEAVFSSMVEGVFTVDTEERITGMNRAGGQLLEVNHEQVRGKSALEAVHNTDLQKFVRMALSNSSPVEGEITLIDDEAKERFFQTHGVRLIDAQEKSSGALIVINDVTNLRRLENVRRDFVANVSHELKTPITSIEGFVETLLDGAMDDAGDASRFLQIIAKQSKRLHAIVEDLLALSRIEQGTEDSKISLEKHTLLETLQAAIQTCGSRATEKQSAVQLDCPNNLTACINPALLEQAMVNLIDNAIKYSPEKSAIKVKAEKMKNDIAIRVSDNGPGISIEDQPRLFERFYRVDKARSNKLGGTGLGLSIVKHIAQAHNGSIELESTAGKGSNFIIHLPD